MLDTSTLAIRVESTGIKEASNALSGLSTTANNTEKRITALGLAMDKLKTNSVSSVAAMQAVTAQLQAQLAHMQGLNTNAHGAASATQALAAAMTLLSTSLVTLSNHQQATTVRQREHNESMKEAHALARGLSGSLGALWVTYGNLAGMAVGVALGASIKNVVAQGLEFEHTLEAIRVRGQETTESIEKIRDACLELGKGIYGPQKVAEAFDVLILAGLNAQQSLSAVGAALNLATVGGTSIEKSAQTLVSVGSSIGYTAEGFDRIGDVIAKTAAVSMSSVESLSEAFKSASSVAKLYGVSLEDIATNLGVLSNLGIQGSAAGTALKNFYKELASEGDKVVNTLSAIGISQDKLKLDNGKFKSLIEVVKVLDEGLRKLPEREEALAIARLSNERGLRSLMQVLGMYREKLDEGGSALEDFNKKIEDSYGFQAKSAIQISLTAKSQVESMMNTLKTVFVQSFKELEPEVLLFTSNMKAAFNSKEFKAGIVSVADAFGRLALTISENLPTLTMLAGAFVAIKAGMIAQAVFTSMAAGVTTLAGAFTALSAGTLTLQAALGPLGIALGIAAAAFVAYKVAKQDAVVDKDANVAAQYSKSYIDGLIAENEKIRFLTQKLKEGKTQAEAERASAADQMKKLDQTAVKSAQAEVDRARENLYKSGLSSEKIAGIKAGPSNTGITSIDNYAESLAKLERAQTRATNNSKLAEAAEKTLTESYKANNDEVKRQAELRKKTGRKEGDIPTASLTDGGSTSTKLTDYQRLNKEINEHKAVVDAAFDSEDKLTEGEKKRAKVIADIVGGYLKMTPLEQVDTIVKLNALVAEEKQLAAWKESQAEMEKRVNSINAEIKTVSERADKNENLIATFGKTKDAIRAEELARLQAQLAQKESLGLCNAETAALRELIQQKEREYKSEQELVRLKKHKTPEEGVNEALRKYREQAEDVGGAIEHTMTRALQGMEDALVNFAETGKLNFTSLANSIISDIIRIQVRMMMTGGKGGDGGLLGALGNIGMSLFGPTGAFGSNAGVAASQGLSMADIGSAFAEGGEPPMGKISLVGEQGPELFIPHQPGTIIPNDKISIGNGEGDASSSSVSVNYAPVINIDSRTDRAEVQQLVQRAVQNGNAQLVEKLSRQGRI